MNVSLTPELEKLIDEKVRSGLYGSASEVVRDGLRLLVERDRARDARLAELRLQLAEGLAAADRGEVADGERVFAEVRRRSAARRRK